jgi:large subunit ribosomal protein L30
MAKIKITLVKSPIDRPPYQKRTLKALGLTKLNTSVVKESNDQIMGMVHAVKHMVISEEI